MSLYFQVESIKVHCTFNDKSAIISLLKKKWLSKKRQRDLNLQKEKYNPEKKRQAVKRKYDDKKESVKQYIKDK